MRPTHFLLVAASLLASRTSFATPYAHYYGPENYLFGVLQVPDLDQRRGTACPVAPSLPNNGESYCAPTSIANWLAYAAARGYTTQWTEVRDWGPGDADSYGIATDHIQAIGEDANTDPDTGGGTSVSGIVTAAQTWFGNAFDVVVTSASSGDLDLVAIAQNGFAGGFGILGYSENNVTISSGGGSGCNPDQSQTWSLNGLVGANGHVVSLSRYERDGNSYYLAFRDPDDSNIDLCEQDVFQSRVVEADYWRFENGSGGGCTLRFKPSNANPSTVLLVNYIVFVVPKWTLVDLPDPDDGSWLTWGSTSQSGGLAGGPALIAPHTDAPPLHFDLAPNRARLALVTREQGVDILRTYTPFGAVPAWAPVSLAGEVADARFVDDDTLVVDDDVGLRLFVAHGESLEPGRVLLSPGDSRLIVVNKLAYDRLPETGGPLPTAFGVLSATRVTGEWEWRGFNEDEGAWVQLQSASLTGLQDPRAAAIDPEAGDLLVADQTADGLLVRRYRIAEGESPVDVSLALPGVQATRMKQDDRGRLVLGTSDGKLLEFAAKDVDQDGMAEYVPVEQRRYQDLSFRSDFLITTTARPWRGRHYEVAHLVTDDLGPTGLGKTVPDCRADLNVDGKVDPSDLRLFITAMRSGGLLADFNGDGVVGPADIEGFVHVYRHGCPPRQRALPVHLRVNPLSRRLGEGVSASEK